MGGWDSRSVSCGNALFEVTLSVHPRALRAFLRGGDGRVWRCVGTVLLTSLWVVSACLCQVSLGVCGEGLPLYPLPLAVAYVSWRRPAWAGVAAALLCGLLYDALTFSRLGVHSLLLCAVALSALWLREVLEELFPASPWAGSVLGGVSVLVYVVLKLLRYSIGSVRGDVLSLVPVHLLLGVAVAALVLAPLQYGVYGAVERLLRVRRRCPTGDGDVVG